MKGIDRLTDSLLQAYDGEPWYGPPIIKVLSDVTAKEAASRPIPGVHSIWELVLHMTAWIGEVEQRLLGGESGDPAGGDWPETPEPSDGAWDEARSLLAAAHHSLVNAFKQFPEDRWNEPMEGTRTSSLTYERMVEGLVQHNVYHLGQISLLKKQLR